MDAESSSLDWPFHNFPSLNWDGSLGEVSRRKEKEKFDSIFCDFHLVKEANGSWESVSRILRRKNWLQTDLQIWSRNGWLGYEVCVKYLSCALAKRRQRSFHFSYLSFYFPTNFRHYLFPVYMKFHSGLFVIYSSEIAWPGLCISTCFKLPILVNPIHQLVLVQHWMHLFLEQSFAFSTHYPGRLSLQWWCIEWWYFHSHPSLSISVASTRQLCIAPVHYNC